MKIADLYIRVSTDEQAEKGFSQRSQEEMLRKYCDLHKIHIRKVIWEDHSAKDFDRPEWQKYLRELKPKKNRGLVDYLLFLKWDRFSRNISLGYQMIQTLRDYGVEAQAIEQPLDLAVPENKIMLALYLATPEVENDRRSLNVKNGMRRAKKEGRYMGLAPVGYINKTDESGKRYITPDKQMAEVITWSFEEIAKGVYNTEQVYKLAREKGFNRTKNVFWTVITNPLYCGMIFINRYKDEPERLIKGIHEPIISADLFYRVQDVLNGRKRGQYQLKVASDSTLPLRGFLVCPTCGKLLTGSRSKGHTKYYSYYHCYDKCNYRRSADQVNDLFLSELKR